MVFAAGLGTRMHPLTHKVPKPMVEVCGRPLIDYTLDKLVEAGVQKAVINTFHLPEIVENHLKARKNIEIVISREEVRLETGGGIVKALPYLGSEPFYVINSDVIWSDDANHPPALLNLAKNWDNSQMDALLLLVKTTEAHGYHGKGDFDFTSNNNEIARLSKQNHSHVFTGIQIFNPVLLQNHSAEPFSLSAIFRQAITENGTLNRIQAIEHKGKWFHVGTVDDIKTTENFLCP